MCVYLQEQKASINYFPCLYDLLLMHQKRKSKTQQLWLSCLTANAQVWLWALKVRNHVPLPPLPSTRGSRTVSSQKAQESRRSWRLRLPFTRTSRLCGDELWVVAGVSTHLHQSIESTQKRPQLKKKNKPSPYLCAPYSFSYKHTLGIFSRSIWTYSSPLCQVLHRPIRWIRLL